MELKPGDMVLVKADAFKGKRKIKNMWKDEACEVVHQIATDMPSYKVTYQCGQSHILHQNQLLLIMSETGIPCVWVSAKHGTDVSAPPESSQLSKEVKVRICHE